MWKISVSFISILQDLVENILLQCEAHILSVVKLHLKKKWEEFGLFYFLRLLSKH